MANYVFNSSSSGERYNAKCLNVSDDSEWTPSVAEYPGDGTIDLSGGTSGRYLDTQWVAPQDTEWTMSGIYNVVIGVSYDMYSIHYKGNQTCDIYLGSSTEDLALSESDKDYTPPTGNWIIEEEPPEIIGANPTPIDLYNGLVPGYFNDKSSDCTLLVSGSTMTTEWVDVTGLYGIQFLGTSVMNRSRCQYRIGTECFWLDQLYNNLPPTEGQIVGIPSGAEQFRIYCNNTGNTTPFQIMQVFEVPVEAYEVNLALSSSTPAPAMPAGVYINNFDTVTVDDGKKLRNINDDPTIHEIHYTISTAQKGTAAALTGDNSGCMSDYQFDQYHYMDSPDSSTIAIYLSAGTYNINISANRDTTDTNRVGLYTLDGYGTVTLASSSASGGNTENCTGWTDVIGTDGYILLTYTADAGSSFSYLNGINIIRQYGR